MRKNPTTWLERTFWPTHLAHTTRHCYVLPEHGGLLTYYPAPELERPRVGGPRRGRRPRAPKRLRLRPAFSNHTSHLPF